MIQPTHNFSFTPDSLENPLVEGNRLFEGKDYAGALRYYALTLQTPALWDRMGLCYSHLHDYDQSIAHFSKALEAEPDNVPALLHRGHDYLSLYVHNNALPSLLQAREDLSKAFSLDSQNKKAIDYLGFCEGQLGFHHVKTGNGQEAMAYFIRSLTVRPHHAQTLTNLGTTQYGLKMFRPALESFSLAIDRFQQARHLAPDYNKALIGRAWSLIALGRGPVAVEELETSYAEEPANTHFKEALIQAVSTLADDCLKKKEWQPAIRYFNRAIQLNDHSYYHFQRAFAYSQTGAYEAALSDLELVQMDFESFLLKGRILLMRQNYSKALNELQAALQLEPNHQEALDLYQKACAKNSELDR